MSTGSITDVIDKLCVYQQHMYKEDLALNNLEGLICKKKKKKKKKQLT